jgi:hypothetical protein
VLLLMAVCKIYLSPDIVLFTNDHLLFDYSCVLNYALQFA